MTTKIRCNKCGKEQLIVRNLPYGWGEIGDELYCKACYEEGAKRILEALSKPKGETQ